jgi:segregation and condensation protein A
MPELVAMDGFEDPPPGVGEDEAFVLSLAAYEGPIHVLLDQAREQKVDLTQISILALAEQYLAFIERARRLRIELAADYLVMAAWLAYLKSRLLLPAEDEDEEPTGAELAEALAFQLRRLEAMRGAGARLMALPQAGRDFFCRGEPEVLETLRIPCYGEGLHDLLSAYGRTLRRAEGARGGLTIEASRLYSMDQALQRLSQLLGGTPGWSTLAAFLPPGLDDPLVARSALAATFAASLELARAGILELRQSGAFQPIYLRRQEPRP